MKYIIHDWNDEQCVRILELCRAAMAPAGRVLVIEHVVPRGNQPDFSKMLDINMLIGPGGRERTREEFASLFGRAGLRLRTVYPTKSPLGILEGIAADG